MKQLFYYIALMAVVLMSACASDETTDNEQPLPEGMGRIRIAISTPENVMSGRQSSTRAVNAVPWEDPDHEWERLQTFRILICSKNDNKVVQIITGTKDQLTEVTHTENASDTPVELEEGSSNTTPSSMSSTHKWGIVTSRPLPAGKYYIYATANYADGYVEGTSVIDLDATVKFANGYSATDATYFGEKTNIPMTGKLTTTPGGTTLREVEVINGATTDVTDTPLAVWRVMAKMQFYFSNLSNEQIEILGVEVEPINQASEGSGIYLFSKDNLESTNNLAPQTSSATDSEAGITLSWPLHSSPLQTGASVLLAGMSSQAAADLFDQATTLTYGEKLSATGIETVTYPEGSKSLFKFRPIVKVNEPDNDATITLTVKLKNGVTFKPTSLSFSACRLGTNGGNFDVASVLGTEHSITSGEKPERNDGSHHNAPSKYSFDLSGDYTSEYKIKIYIYNLDITKDIAFSDIFLTGIVKNTESAATSEKLTLPTGALADVGPVSYTSSLTLAAGDTTHDPFFFYINETDATYTTTNNQLSLRFKIRRGGNIEEVRYGVTTSHDLTTGGIYGGQRGGFNVIRRNDWIHIPVVLTDWQMRIEPLAFVPIAGYPPVTMSSDGLTATFDTGGMIALQPFIKKYDDTSWRDFSDPAITLVSVHWTNIDGTDVSGSSKIVKTPFVYDETNKCLIGELNNSLPNTYTASSYKTTFTVSVKLGLDTGAQYDYSFTFNVILH